MQSRYSTPNQIGSMPSHVTSGMKIGREMSIMMTWSMNTPRNISNSIKSAITVTRASPD